MNHLGTLLAGEHRGRAAGDDTTDTTLGLPPRQNRGEYPFWHRPAPAVAVVRLDPGFAALRSVVPEGWVPLVRAKYSLDALTTVAHTPNCSELDYEHRSKPLLRALIRDLADVARQAPQGLLRRQAGAAAEAAYAYARTGRWTTTELEPPSPDEPWLFCGPLRSWATQDSPQPLALFVGQPQAVAQRTIDRVSRHRDAIQVAVGTALDQAVVPEGVLPEMFAVDLYLLGGTADSGHKNFAHFFPLESPAGRVSRTDFTVVFSNVHRERLIRCSLPLLAAVGGSNPEIDPIDLLQASLAWFRAYDLARFWKTDRVGLTGASALRPFEEMVLNEALADTLGVLSLADLVDPATLGTAFSAELLRYLSRNHHEFADTTAAALEVGWLAEETDLAWTEPARWCETALPSFAQLARSILAARDGSPAASARLRGGLDTGRHLISQWSGLLAATPTDLEYSFG
jgi:hypothetical protein